MKRRYTAIIAKARRSGIRNDLQLVEPFLELAIIFDMAELSGALLDHH